MAIQENNWVQAVASGQLTGPPVVFKHGKKQIAIVRAGGGVFAVDNRCPHEGYPLAKGTVDDQCQLTCNWHNWKFRLQDGECVLGGDDVRAYPAKEEDGFIWVDLSDVPVEVTQRRILKGLRIAFERREFARICREVTRLQLSGIDPKIAVERGIEWSFERLEYGFTHAYAATADWLAEAQRYRDDWESQLICIAESIDHMAFDALRHGKYPFAKSASEFDRGALREAIEAEDREQAEGLVNRAFDDGLHWQDLERSFVGAALAHYNDFGHSLIYVYKAGQIGEVLPNKERELSLALVRSLCYSTREDLIPEFHGYAIALEQISQEKDPSAPPSESSESCPFPASTKSALNWVVERWPSVNATRIYDRLLETLARNMVHYDTSYGSAWDRPVSQNVGWLNFTHGITFANAVRVCCSRYPEFWQQGLLQMACFVGRNHAFLDQAIDVKDWLVDDTTEFFTGVRQTMLDHGFRDPIFSAHVVKTAVAVEEELPLASPSCQRFLLAALNRFFQSPIKQKHVRRFAHQAIDLVRRDYE